MVTLAVGIWFAERDKCQRTLEIFDDLFNDDVVVRGFSLAFDVSLRGGMRAVRGEPCGFFGEGYVLIWVEGIVDYTLETLVIIM